MQFHPIPPRSAMPVSAARPRPRPDWALFLDFDGTLVDFAPRPDAVRPARDLVSVLAGAAHALGGALAVVTGRPIHEIDHWLDRSVTAVAGLHGAERRSAAGRVVAPAGAAPPRAEVDRARTRLAEVAGANEGVLLEDKGRGFVLHYRTARDHTSAGDACVDAVRALESPSFEVLLGDSLAELRVRGVDKGTAVAAFMAEPPFARRTPVFVGDDITDEDGFRAVNEMGGIAVLAGSARRPTAARHRLPDVENVIAWLRSVPRAVAP